MVQLEGIGNVAVTMTVSGTLGSGQVCKIAGNGTASACAAGGEFHGVVNTMGDGTCGVILRGSARVSYSGATAPVAGVTGLSADGNGGVKADADGDAYLVLSVDTVGKTLVLFL